MYVFDGVLFYPILKGSRKGMHRVAGKLRFGRQRSVLRTF
jgi:hypothetical protein